MKDDNRTGFYLHQVHIKEKLRGALKTGLYTGTPGAESILVEVYARVKNIENNCSKVVDENGEPLVVYHYTDEQFSAFDPAMARVNSDIQALFFMDNAMDWQDMGGRKMECFLNIRKPVEKPMVDAVRNEAGKLKRDELIAQGYDGTFLTEDGATEWAAFYPNQVKSVDNRGTWSNEDNRISFSVIGPKARTWGKYDEKRKWMEADAGEIARRVS